MTSGRTLINALGLSSVAFGAAPLGNEYGDVDGDEMASTVAQALDEGITTFDTSPYYGRTLSELRLGAALRGRREQATIITKAGRYDRDYPEGFDFTAARLRRSIDESLQRLGTDYVDVLLLHDIEFAHPDQITGEAIDALQTIKQAGKARAIGASSYRLDVLTQVIQTGMLDVVLTFCHTDLVDASAIATLEPVAAAHDVALLAASPLHMGLLTPAGGPDWHPALPDAVDRAADVRRAAKSLEVDVVDIALAYALGLDGITSTVVGVSNRAELAQLVAARDATPDPDLMSELLRRVGEPVTTPWDSGVWPQGPGDA